MEGDNQLFIKGFVNAKIFDFYSKSGVFNIQANAKLQMEVAASLHISCTHNFCTLADTVIFCGNSRGELI